MTTSYSSFPPSDSAASLTQVEAVKPSRTLTIFRVIGYGLLGLSFTELLYVLIPPEFTNPVWEYQTVGDLVKLIPVPLLALMLVFYGETTARNKLERQILRLVSWMTLLAGLLFLLLIPLTLSNTVRISQYNNDQINTQVTQQQQQLEATRQQLEQASAEQLQSLVPVPDAEGRLPDAPSTPEQAKAQLLTNLERAKQQADSQASEARNNLQQNLLKNTAKLTVESFIGGFAFLYIWSVTRWARQMKSYGFEPALQTPSIPWVNSFKFKAPRIKVPQLKALPKLLPRLPRRSRRRRS